VAEVILDKVGKVYLDGTRAVDGLSLDVGDGEFLVLVGPSGCGKTTALRMIAGLEDITEGTLKIGPKVVNHVPPRDRDLAMVFQSYALYPHLDVYDNIAFGLRLRKVSKSEIERRVNQAAEMLGLTEHLRRRPRSLSGGQRQRVAMGRAMVREPAAFLMDEPLSNLDAKLRVQMRAEIARTTRRLGVTTIYVTHDQTEAMTLGQRVAVMKKGVLQQVAAPQDLYDKPANIFVAGFIGSPAMNLARGVFTRRPGEPEPDDARSDSARHSAETDRTSGMVLVLGDQQLPVDPGLLEAHPGLLQYLDRPVAVGIRPEDMEDAHFAPPGAVLHAVADLTEALGSDLLVHFTAEVAGVVTEDIQELARDVGADPVDTGAEHTEMVARFNPRSQVREGDRIEVVVDTTRLHVFDLDTGQAIW
jgi:multiple sugar transport system ATP-binding protein